VYLLAFTWKDAIFGFTVYSCRSVLVKWNWKIKHCLFAYIFFDSISAKHCPNRSMSNEVITSQMCAVFDTHCRPIFRPTYNPRLGASAFPDVLTSKSINLQSTWNRPSLSTIQRFCNDIVTFFPDCHSRWIFALLMSTAGFRTTSPRITDEAQQGFFSTNYVRATLELLKLDNRRSMRTK